MTTETRVRSLWNRCTAGVHLSARTMLVAALLLALPAIVEAQTIVELLNTEVGGTGSSAYTAWGDFTGNELWTVCTLMDTEELPPGPQSFEVVSGTADFTSPEGSVNIGGAVGWTINQCTAGPGVGGQLSSGVFVIPNEPPPFPVVQAYDLEPGRTSTVSYDGSGCLFFCLQSTNPDFHMAGYLVAGATVWVAQGPQTPQPAASYEIGADVQVALGASPTPTPSVSYIPQGGAGPGSGGAEFDTRYWVFNAALTDVEYEIDIQPREVQGFSGVYTDTLTVDETRSLLIGDHVSGQFGTIRDTAAFDDLPFESANGNGDSPDTMSQAVIFATLPDGSQYGQYFQFRAADEALQAGETGWLFTTHDPDRYRVNIGVTAVADGTRVVLTPRGAGGAALGNPRVVEFDEGGNTQFNNIYGGWNLGSATDVMVEAVVESGAAFVFSSILDGRGQVQGTSDPTSVLPYTEGASRVVLLEMGRITGLNEFSGSASVYNHGGGQVDIQVDFHERGVPGVAASSSFSLGPMETISWDDAVGELVNRTGVVGSLVFTVQGGGDGGISAIGREFAIFRNGGGDVTGTAGQAMPGLADSDQLMPGETFHFIGLRDRQLAQGTERSHLGMLNLGFGDVTVTVSGYADDGTPEGSIQRSVRAGEQLRANRILRAINPNQDGGIKRIEVTVTGGPVHALAYLVNSTGDPVTLLPFRR